jgi:hypothetical protein
VRKRSFVYKLATYVCFINAIFFLPRQARDEHLYIKPMILPRQARDKYRENSLKKQWRSLTDAMPRLNAMQVKLSQMTAVYTAEDQV